MSKRAGNKRKSFLNQDLFKKKLFHKAGAGYDFIFSQFHIGFFIPASIL